MDGPDGPVEEQGRYRAVRDRLGQQVEDLRVDDGLAVPREPGREAAGLPDAVLQCLEVRRGHLQAGRTGGQRAPPDQFVVHASLLSVAPFQDCRRRRRFAPVLTPVCGPSDWPGVPWGIRGLASWFGFVVWLPG